MSDDDYPEPCDECGSENCRCIECPKCDGRGQTETGNTCAACGGTGISTLPAKS